MQEAKSAPSHPRISYSNDKTSAMVAGRVACMPTAGVDITSCCALLVHVMDPHTPATAGHQSCSHRALRLFGEFCELSVAQPAVVCFEG